MLLTTDSFTRSEALILFKGLVLLKCAYTHPVSSTESASSIPRPHINTVCETNPQGRQWLAIDPSSNESSD